MKKTLEEESSIDSVPCLASGKPPGRIDSYPSDISSYACREEHPHSYLSQRIFDACPSFPQMNDFQKMTALRDWVYSNCDASFDCGLSLRERDSQDNIYWQLPLSYVLELFERNQLALRCAGLSHTLMRIYRSLGFRAWYYDFGVLDKVTHCVTLVEVQGDIYLQDALFNSEFVDSHGKPLPFFKVLGLLLNNDKVMVQEGSTWARKVHFPGPAAGGWPVEHRSRTSPPRQVDNSFVHLIHYNRTLYLQYALDQDLWRQIIDNYGLPENFDCLMLLPIAIFEEDGYHQEPRNSELLSRIVRCSGRWGCLSSAGGR